LGELGLGAQVAWTPEDRSALVRRSGADSGCRCIVAVGGDGTVSGVLNERPTAPISVLPAGTENLVARHYGLVRDPCVLARTIANGQSVRVDVGEVRERRFLLMVGFGFDGDIVTGHHESRVTRAGLIRPTHRGAYCMPILRSSLTYRFPEITVRIRDQGTDEVLVGTTVFVFNAPRYALGLPFAPTAADDDGWLDLVLFRKPGPFHALHYLWQVFRGIHFQDPSVQHRCVKHVEVTGQAPIPVQIDGDPGGYVHPEESAASGANWTVRIVPCALNVIAGPPSRARTAPAQSVRNS
jgi:diacylglycerol kinase (ATP)